MPQLHFIYKNYVHPTATGIESESMLLLLYNALVKHDVKTNAPRCYRLHCFLVICTLYAVSGIGTNFMLLLLLLLYNP